MTADGLHRIRTTRVGAVFLKPGAKFAGYDQIIIDPVSVTYKSKPRKQTASTRGRGNFELKPSNMERLKRFFQEEFEKELGKSQDYQVVTDPAANVLRVSGHIVDLVVDAPQTQRGSDIDFVMTAGKMTLILDVRDSVTGEPLARIADRRAIQPAAGGPGRVYQSTPTRNWGEVRRRFQNWARLLRQGLDELKQLPEVPEAPTAS